MKSGVINIFFFYTKHGVWKFFYIMREKLANFKQSLYGIVIKTNWSILMRELLLLIYVRLISEIYNFCDCHPKPVHWKCYYG